MNKILSPFKNKLKTDDERNTKIRNNIFVTFLFKGGSMLVNLALVPITISFVNPTEYGIWLTLSSIIAWFGISDIGFGHGLRNKFAEAVAIGDTKLARSYVSTTYVALSIIIFVIWFVFLFANHFIDWSLVLNTPNSMAQELSKVVLIIFTFFSLQFVFKLVGTVLTANQEPGKAAGFDFIANLFVMISIYVIMYLNIDGSLEILAILTGVYQLLVFVVASLWFFNRELKDYKPSIKYFEKKQIKSLMGLGIKFFIIQISMIFIFQSTNIIITQLLGPEQVTVYNIAYKYFTISMTVALIMVAPLWSAFTDAYAKKDFEWMKKVYKQMAKFLALMIIVLIAFFFISNFAYKVWINNEVAISKEISFLMMLNIIFATTYSIFIPIINGAGKLKVQLAVNVLMCIIYIPLAIVLGKQSGLAGIIVANVLVNLVYAILVPVQCYRIVNNKATGYWNK